MCLLLFKPADKKVPDKHLVIADKNNPHGCGVAIATGDKIIIEKSPTWGAEEIIKVLNKYEGHPAIVHFRYATHGSKTDANTHPFSLGENWVAAHNGIISNVDTLPDESDTRAFLRLNVIPMLEHGWNLTDKDVIDLLSQEMGTGNKMTFMSKTGEISIANEKSGHWKDGIWYSNGGYITCSYYSNYDEDDYDYEQAYYNSRHYNPYHKVTPPVAPAVNKPRYSAFGQVIVEEDNTSVSPHALMVLPDKVNNYKEKWIRLDTLNTVCDCCGEEIWGPYVLETTNQMIVCEECQRFLPDSLNIPKNNSSSITQIISNMK